MIIARLHKGGLEDSLKTAKTFGNIEEMKQWFVSEYENAFSECDISISEDFVFDARNGWNTRYVYTQKYLGDNSIICIGLCDLNLHRLREN